jgi:hypothetical protein
MENDVAINEVLLLFCSRFGTKNKFLSSGKLWSSE